MKMHPSTLIALQDSITHWTRLAEGTSEKLESIYSSDCALCHKFNNAMFLPGRCYGCPVAEKTGKANCIGTPWQFAEHAYVSGGKNTHTFKSAAKNMLAFLQEVQKEVLAKNAEHDQLEADLVDMCHDLEVGKCSVLTTWGNEFRPLWCHADGGGPLTSREYLEVCQRVERRLDPHQKLTYICYLQEEVSTQYHIEHKVSLDFDNPIAQYFLATATWEMRTRALKKVLK